MIITLLSVVGSMVIGACSAWLLLWALGEYLGYLEYKEKNNEKKNL